MRILRRIPPRPPRLSAPVAAIGIFDGVHRGHQAILKKALERARALRGTAVAITFDPHPIAVLRPAQVPPMLSSLEQRLRRFAALGIRWVLVVPFTRSFSRWGPEKFVRHLLVKRLRAREVVVGHDFGFGAGRKGNVRTLRRLGQRYGFQVHAVPPVRGGGERISSGSLRRLVQSGRLREARRRLGWPVTVVGRVVHGAHRGKSLGFPTANLRIEAGVPPPTGVYAVRTRCGSRVWRGTANLGFRPTFEEDVSGVQHAPLLEVHLFGRRQSLYGRRLEVALVQRIRSERRFPSPHALVLQLTRDARRARAILRHSGAGFSLYTKMRG